MTPLSILQQKKNVLEDIVPHADKLAILLHKLRNFYFIDSTHNLRTGSFIRWVSIVEDEAKLHHGGFFCQIQDDHIKIKMFGNRYATALLQDILLFQKFSPEELVILSAIQSVS